MPERTIHDEALGTLTWNSRLDWWESQAEWAPGRRVGVSLSVEADNPDVMPTAEIAHVHRVLSQLPELEPEARQLAADELLEIYNEEWNDGEPLSSDEFVARLTLEDIGVAADGSAELFYQDGGLFAGHTVLVSPDDAGNLDNADIAG